MNAYQPLHCDLHDYLEIACLYRYRLLIETVERARRPFAQEIEVQRQIGIGVQVGLVLVQQARHARQGHARQVAAAGLRHAGRQRDAGGAPGAVIDMEQHGFIRHEPAFQ